MYTNGTQFTLNNEKYIGDYCQHTDGYYYTGKIFVWGKSKLLQTIQKQQSLSKKINQYFNLNQVIIKKYNLNQLFPFTSFPTQQQIKNGWMFKYYCFDSIKKITFQITKEDYQMIINNPKYKTAKVKWIINDDNQIALREIKNLNK